MKNKAFTLIELLAVIIILGILMLIAIPSVTNYINNSRKSTYVTTVNELVKGTIAKVNSGDLNMFDTDTTYYVPCTCIKLENGEAKSPYGKFDPAYVVVTFDGTNYHYYFTGKDVQNMGVPTLTSSDVLSKESIVANVEAIDTSVGIEGTSNVYVFSDECNGEGEIGPAGTTVSGGSSSSGSGSGSSSSGTTICKKQNCIPVTPTIYWALQDTDSDGINDKLVISDKEVDGNYKGNFSGDRYFGTQFHCPWGYNKTLPADSSHLSYNVNTVVVEGKVAPMYTIDWFEGLGENASKLTMDLTNLYTCNVKSMQGMFNYVGGKDELEIIGLCSWDTSKVEYLCNTFQSAGRKAKKWNIGDISNWDTTNVKMSYYMFSGAAYDSTYFELDLSKWNTSKNTDMTGMFERAGYNATTWDIGDIGKWNVSNLKGVRSMFRFAGSNATTFNLDLSSWDTSKMTNMEEMFLSAGLYSTTCSLGDLSNWDTSNVTDMHDMFYGACARATNWSLGNLSNWDTSNVKNMSRLFKSTGGGSTNYSLNISNWNTSKVENMSEMFDYTGSKATSWSITIPKNNNAGLNNLTTAMYGKDSSISISPPSGRSFTIAS